MGETLNPKAEYETLIIDRKNYEDRAEALANVTIPYLFPTTSANASSILGDSYGSRYASGAINLLASRMTLALLPASGSSFRFDPDANGMEVLTQGDTNKRAVIMAELNKQSIRVNKEIENQMIRPVFNEFMLSLIAVCPVVVEKVKDNGIKWHNLRNFAVKLSDTGEPLIIIVKETLDKNNLPEGITVDPNKKDDIELYTMCKLEEKKWNVTQSIGSEVVREESYKENDLPYVYLGWHRQSGDTYHRPYAEKFRGILEDYGKLNKVLVEGSIIASKSVILVNPLGSTRKIDVVNSENGKVIDGRTDDITSFQLQKNFDFQTPLTMKNELMQQIDKAFLSRQGTQRNAERVTAEEVRADAQELESALTGMYSTMSKKFSKWLVLQVMKELKIKFNAIDVNVITGLDALGKNLEAQKLDGFMMRLAQMKYTEYINESEVITRYASYDGIDTTGLIKTPAEVSKQRQAAADAQAKQAMMESGANQMGQNVINAAIPDPSKQPQQ